MNVKYILLLYFLPYSARCGHPVGGLGALDDSFADVDLRAFRIGYSINQDDGTRPDNEPLVKATRRQAEEGNPFAQRRLGAMLYLGLGVVQDAKEAYVWLERFPIRWTSVYRSEKT